MRYSKRKFFQTVASREQWRRRVPWKLAIEGAQADVPRVSWRRGGRGEQSVIQSRQVAGAKTA